MNLGIALALLQLAFALTWVIYVIYLPALALQAGLPKHAVPWILLMDQAIFVLCDWAAGVYADRTAAALGRIGSRIAIATAISAAAFLLMPWLAPAGSPLLFIALTVVWSATSSALRAPPFMLIGRHAVEPRKPWLAGLYLLGLGVAAALAPYLGSALKGIDPRIPFAMATAAVVVMTFALVAAERRLGTPKPASAPTRMPASRLAAFAFAVALFAVGFQVHFSVNSAPAYLRFATAADLEKLMPVFWIGFNLLVLPATLLTKRFGGVPVMAIAGVAGSLCALAAPQARTLETLVALQFAIGAAWGAVLTGGFTAALEAGKRGREGSATGLLFSMLAVAAFARIAFVAADLPKSPELAPWLAMLPLVAWAAASALLLLRVHIK